MSRIFAYCRVSTNEQSTENQLHAIRSEGYEINDDRAIHEIISGKISAKDRPEFHKLIEYRMEHGDTLVITDIDRMGRDLIDIHNTIEHILEMGIKLVILSLPVSDLTKPEAMLILNMFSVFSQYERDKISKRTKNALGRLKAQGKKLGRPVAVNTTTNVQEQKAKGLSQSKTAKVLGVSLPTVKRHWNK